MEQVPLSDNLGAIFQSRLVPVQVVDGKGKVIGTFVPRLTEDDVKPDGVVAGTPEHKTPERTTVTGVRICEAGNTGYRCLLAILAKGFHVRLEYHKLDKPILHWDDHMPWYWAKRNGNDFMAYTPEALLGLIAMHEVHGDDWRHWADGEQEAVERIYDTAQTFDRDGNLLPDE